MTVCRALRFIEVRTATRRQINGSMYLISMRRVAIAVFEAASIQAMGLGLDEHSREIGTEWASNAATSVLKLRIDWQLSSMVLKPVKVTVFAHVVTSRNSGPIIPVRIPFRLLLCGKSSAASNS